jgi:hypothetical protein
VIRRSSMMVVRVRGVLYRLFLLGTSPLDEE